mmetsp:Transcript_19484/g.74772  ORF Transcript_19484/g.74772 Transcript_19484/m.74772 type:complete len:209 (+) Transcript_19484:925-1551(+)
MRSTRRLLIIFSAAATTCWRPSSSPNDRRAAQRAARLFLSLSHSTPLQQTCMKLMLLPMRRMCSASACGTKQGSIGWRRAYLCRHSCSAAHASAASTKNSPCGSWIWPSTIHCETMAKRGALAASSTLRAKPLTDGSPWRAKGNSEERSAPPWRPPAASSIASTSARRRSGAWAQAKRRRREMAGGRALPAWRAGAAVVWASRRAMTR